MMENELPKFTSVPTPEQMAAVLLSNGWQTLWSPNFWIRKTELISNDIKGYTLEDAFHQVLTLQMHAEAYKILANRPKRFPDVRNRT